MRRAAAAFVALLAVCPGARAAEPGAEAALLTRLETARRAYDAVQDYTAVFYKEERGTDGKPAPREKILLKFEKPFKIFLGWLDSPKKGLQVHYERGKHGNKLVIHKPGLLFGLAPLLFLEQTSPWVREGGSASFDIEDAGIGTFLEDFAKAVERARQEGKLRATETAAGLFETIFENTTEEDEDYFAYRIVVGFDKKTSLPVKMDLYDWQDARIGSYAYEEIDVNVGARDPRFEKTADKRLLRVYRAANR